MHAKGEMRKRVFIVVEHGADFVLSTMSSSSSTWRVKRLREAKSETPSILSTQTLQEP